jgi:peptidyl-prolyl cis-trans isomerase SurA
MFTVKCGKRRWAFKAKALWNEMIITTGIRGKNKKMEKIKRYTAVMLMAGLMVLTGGFTSMAEDLEVVDRIVAIVNDEIITYTMVNEAFVPYEKTIRAKGYPLDKEIELRFKIRSNLIQQLIDQEITNQAVKKAQISISDGEVDNYIERIKQTNSFTDEDLREMLEKEGVELEQYKKEIKNILLRNKLIQYEIKSRIVVTQKEIDDYYEKNKDKFADKKKEEVSELIGDKIYELQSKEKFDKWVANLREQSQIKINE